MISLFSKSLNPGSGPQQPPLQVWGTQPHSRERHNLSGFHILFFCDLFLRFLSQSWQNLHKIPTQSTDYREDGNHSSETPVTYQIFTANTSESLQTAFSPPKTELFSTAQNTHSIGWDKICYGCGWNGQQDRQCTYNVTVWYLHGSLLPWKINSITYLCARACVALLIQHATRMRYIVSSLVTSPNPPNFSTLSHKRHDFREGENVIEHKCTLWFSLQLSSKISFIVRRI